MCIPRIQRPSTSSRIFFASPNNIRMFSLKNSGSSTALAEAHDWLRPESELPDGATLAAALEAGRRVAAPILATNR